MYSRTGPRLLDTNYAREQVTQYRAAREREEVLRKRLMELADPDHAGSWGSSRFDRRLVAAIKGSEIWSRVVSGTHRKCGRPYFSAVAVKSPSTPYGST
jgi:hypothetical protein